MAFFVFEILAAVRQNGINFDNCNLAIEAGANILVSGTTIFKENNGNIKKNIDLFKSS